ncbi:uncharacterized protein BDR25DRAFT_360302 [Lindgomyces ingoldianus]|uniref:Uncharacterized protein n=1 Tax=Lindgomyces ingoldianus TaxID=673940 RepID=A0ACB6QFV2_9PLEO|nr:uncharacterized protein BDR25DRAFT_360302 [Lindgomyces ingoldianus]KAF2465776.1 hypothetical protein BDR25DRAFT_360302 [Lindgomyces ingoldianus]
MAGYRDGRMSVIAVVCHIISRWAHWSGLEVPFSSGSIENYGTYGTNGGRPNIRPDRAMRVRYAPSLAAKTETAMVLGGGFGNELGSIPQGCSALRGTTPHKGVAAHSEWVGIDRRTRRGMGFRTEIANLHGPWGCANSRLLFGEAIVSAEFAPESQSRTHHKYRNIFSISHMTPFYFSINLGGSVRLSSSLRISPPLFLRLFCPRVFFRYSPLLKLFPPSFLSPLPLCIACGSRRQAGNLDFVGINDRGLGRACTNLAFVILIPRGRRLRRARARIIRGGNSRYFKDALTNPLFTAASKSDTITLRSVHCVLALHLPYVDAPRNVVAVEADITAGTEFARQRRRRSSESDLNTGGNFLRPTEIYEPDHFPAIQHIIVSRFIPTNLKRPTSSPHPQLSHRGPPPNDIVPNQTSELPTRQFSGSNRIERFPSSDQIRDAGITCFLAHVPGVWQAFIALHRTLLQEQHDFFLASQDAIRDTLCGETNEGYFDFEQLTLNVYDPLFLKNYVRIVNSLVRASEPPSDARKAATSIGTSSGSESPILANASDPAPPTLHDVVYPWRSEYPNLTQDREQRRDLKRLSAYLLRQQPSYTLRDAVCSDTYFGNVKTYHRVAIERRNPLISPPLIERKGGQRYSISNFRNRNLTSVVYFYTALFPFSPLIPLIPQKLPTPSPPGIPFHPHIPQPQPQGSKLNTMRQPPTTTILPPTNCLRFDRPISSTQPKTIPSVSRIKIAFPEHVAESSAEGGGLVKMGGIVGRGYWMGDGFGEEITYTAPGLHFVARAERSLGLGEAAGEAEMADVRAKRMGCFEKMGCWRIDRVEGIKYMEWKEVGVMRMDEHEMPPYHLPATLLTDIYRLYRLLHRKQLQVNKNNPFTLSLTVLLASPVHAGYTARPMQQIRIETKT